MQPVSMKGVLFLERREFVSATGLQVRGAIIGTREIQGDEAVGLQGSPASERAARTRAPQRSSI